MTFHLRPSSLLWATFLALGATALALRIRHPEHGALPLLTAALLVLLALRLISMLLDWRAGRLSLTRLLLPAVLLAEGLGLAMTGASEAATTLRFATAAGLEVLLLVLAMRVLTQSKAQPGLWPEDRIAAAFSAFVHPGRPGSWPWSWLCWAAPSGFWRGASEHLHLKVSATTGRLPSAPSSQPFP